MQRLKIYSVLVAIVLTLALNMIVPEESHAQTPQPPVNSVESSPTPVTPADDLALRRACAEAVEELRAGRKLLEKQDIELKLQGEMLALEREISTGLKNIRSLDATEKTALRDALAAKDRQIAAQEGAIAALKKNRWTFWKASKAVALGAAAGIVIGAVVINR